MNRVFPAPGIMVEIDLPDGTSVARGVEAVHARGDGRLGLTLRTMDGEPEFVTIAPVGETAWVCVEPPLDIRHAVSVAECVIAGVPLHGPAIAPEKLLAQALLQVTGVGRKPKPCLIRIDGDAR